LQKPFYKNKEERISQNIYQNSWMINVSLKNECSNKNKNSKIFLLMSCKNLFIKTKKRDFPNIWLIEGRRPLTKGMVLNL
jgi:hypothetical protein